MSIFADRLKELRAERGWSQQQLADILETSKQVISRYETDQRTPKISIANKYADKLGIELNYLLGLDAKEKTAAIEDDGLSEIKRDLINDLKYLSDEDIQSLQPLIRNLLKSKSK